MSGESQLQAKLSDMPSILLAAGKPLPEQDKPSSDKGTDEAVNIWIEFYHGMSGIIGVVAGYLLVTSTQIERFLPPKRSSAD